MRVVIFSVVFSCWLAGCSWMPFVDSEEEKKAKAAEHEEELKTLTEKQFYDRIQRNLDSKNWTEAITNLQSFEAQFPFGNYAEQAQLELIYVYFESLDHEAAAAAADRFIRLHPRHPNVDYAYYIKGLAAISKTRGLFSNFIPIDESRRDPGEARQAFAIFTELLNRFPNSAYAADARKRMLHLRSLLARHEIQVANYYFKRGAYLAAVNRGRYVVENFQQTPAVPDALAVMAQGYHLLGLNDLADNTVQVLAANYSNHPALDEQGHFKYTPADLKDDEHWISRVTLGYYKPEKPPQFDSRELYNPIHRHVAELRNGAPVEAWSGARGAPESDSPPAAEKRSWLSRLTFGLLD